MKGDGCDRVCEFLMLVFCLFLMFFILAAYVDTTRDVPNGRPEVGSE